jgi:uncharacterized protein (TIGR03083 family)
MMQEQVQDLRDEATEFQRLLEPLADADWDRATLFKSWTINDILQHLYSGDERAVASIANAERYDALSAALNAAREGGVSRGWRRPAGVSVACAGGICGSAIANRAPGSATCWRS